MATRILLAAVAVLGLVALFAVAYALGRASQAPAYESSIEALGASEADIQRSTPPVLAEESTPKATEHTTIRRAQPPKRVEEPAPIIPLDAQNVVGSEWEVGGRKMTVSPGGVLKIDGAADGEWVIEGSRVTLKTPEGEVTGTIDGYDIVIDGEKAFREN